MGKEQLNQQGWSEKTGYWLRNGGIVAALIGLLFSEPLLAAGVIFATGGEILRRSQRKGK